MAMVFVNTPKILTLKGRVIGPITVSFAIGVAFVSLMMVAFPSKTSALTGMEVSVASPPGNVYLVAF